MAFDIVYTKKGLVNQYNKVISWLTEVMRQPTPHDTILRAKFEGYRFGLRDATKALGYDFVWTNDGKISDIAVVNPVCDDTKKRLLSYLAREMDSNMESALAMKNSAEQCLALKNDVAFAEQLKTSEAYMERYRVLMKLAQEMGFTRMDIEEGRNGT